ncbi:MAG: hypothetical protein CR217_15175 [Beijerinckiaceae bacterium]|nr:MAG: hypothetical protein CR217_15175 [Beijerinckiaceae bacterium]
MTEALFAPRDVRVVPCRSEMHRDLISRPIDNQQDVVLGNSWIARVIEPKIFEFGNPSDWNMESVKVQIQRSPALTVRGVESSVVDMFPLSSNKFD